MLGALGFLGHLLVILAPLEQLLKPAWSILALSRLILDTLPILYFEPKWLHVCPPKDHLGTFLESFLNHSDLIPEPAIGLGR